MSKFRLQGLIAATYTPLNDNGSVNVSPIPAIVDLLISQGVNGLYVCGSTGEGMSLTSDERRQVSEAYVKAAKGRVPVIVQVGHNSLAESRELARHAQEIGVDVTSATCPSYFKVGDVETLINCMAEVASGAPDLPFYYYHIPALTGSTLDMVKFLELAGERIPNLAGLKYTDTKLFEFQECLELNDGQFDVVWGCDEMLLGALATGSRAAIGSTYNVAAPLYQRIIDAFESGQIDEARRGQAMSVKMIRTINQFPFHSAMKAILGMQGISMGDCRLPQGRLTDEAVSKLKVELESIGFFDWSQTTVH
ncbi:dihydrodipicolinate synthase family protein [Planctomicrobium sp.]|jgi:N-acetylneuraminate lyase|nr:dihydrodipicolinate synthase family protein [Planctomicrobium sp.]MBT5020303.1 N-acetylneuraminate lyase [Planctomicrobium sp.]MDA7528143.1 dihydrodipicolinate synthase family protein [bacterium]MDB4732895.1 dihydrodipicolinate synthase family protein [Planctomicrobium sp.]MDB4743747.1 dihydrodipicolinate synthase family protein [Planctomicrobium sp.]